MAFDKDSLFRGAFYSSSVWRYSTPDSIDIVLASTYFVPAWPQLKANDLIIASVAEGLSIISVVSVSMDSVVVAIDLTPSLSVDSIQFDKEAGVSVVEGQAAWNNVDKTLDLGLTDGVVLQMGQESLVRVLNNTGGTLVDGEVVYITGAQGNRTTVAKTRADLVTADLTIGVVTQTILNNQSGFLTLTGLVRNFDTSMWNEGDELWLSGSVLGGITNIKPTAPDNSVHIGFVVRSHATLGSIFVRVLSEESVSDLHDVILTNLQDGDILVYDSAAGVWRNEAPV